MKLGENWVKFDKAKATPITAGWYFCANHRKDQFFAHWRSGMWRVHESGFSPDTIVWWREKFPEPEDDA